MRAKESSKNNNKEISPPKNTKPEIVKKRGRPGLKSSNKLKESPKLPQNSLTKHKGTKRRAPLKREKSSEQSEIVGLVEYGRRQSKRVTVPRSAYLYMGY